MRKKGKKRMNIEMRKMKRRNEMRVIMIGMKDNNIELPIAF